MKASRRGFPSRRFSCVAPCRRFPTGRHAARETALSRKTCNLRPGPSAAMCRPCPRHLPASFPSHSPPCTFPLPAASSAPSPFPAPPRHTPAPIVFPPHPPAKAVPLPLVRKEALCHHASAPPAKPASAHVPALRAEKSPFCARRKARPHIFSVVARFLHELK